MIGGFIILSSFLAKAQPFSATLESPKIGPKIEDQAFIYTDMDTTGQRIFVLIESGLWEFDLQQHSWAFLDSLSNRPQKLEDFEFGYNTARDILQLWSRGVGIVYNISLDDYNIKRADNSFAHKNQYFHYPFYDSTGTLHAFGGYGLWEWKNKITFYNHEINEWNIQPVSPSSPFPPKRTPYTGAYDPLKYQFYLYGGNHPQAGRQVDHHTVKKTLHDLWKFNFGNQQWSEIATYSRDSLVFHKPSDLKRLTVTNAITSSAFSPISNMLYLPFRRENQSSDVIIYQPINVQTGSLLERFKINFGTLKQFMPTNFFFNLNTGHLLFVGSDYLSIADTFPVRVYTVDENIILNRLTEQDQGYHLLAWGIGIGVLLLLVILTLLAGRKKSGSTEKAASRKFLLSGIQQYEWLTAEEKKLLTHLREKQSFCETQEIEDLLWPDIENYDYRRRLRNDIIKNINRKVRSRSSFDEKLIITKKDSSDRRKNLYGINPSFR